MTKPRLGSILEPYVGGGGNQIEARPKAFPPIAIPLAQNAKDFQLANDILDQDAFSSQGTIPASLFCAQRMQLGFLGRGLTVGMDVA